MLVHIPHCCTVIIIIVKYSFTLHMRCIAPTGTYLHFQCARHTNLVSTGTKMEGLVEFTIIADFKLNSNDMGDEY